MDDPNGIIRVNADGSTELVADLSAFVKANPVAEPNPLDFEPDEGAYALETSAGVNPDAPIIPGTGRVVRMTDAGEWEPVATGLVFPTAMTFGADGNLYISNFGFGFPPGAVQIVRVDMTAPLPG